MHVINIDKAKNPDIAELVADKEPGAKIDLHTSIKENNDQNVSFTVEECSEGKKPDDEESDEASPDDESAETPAAEPAKKPEKSYGKKYMEAAGMEE